jgi:hypothetical protein
MLNLWGERDLGSGCPIITPGICIMAIYPKFGQIQTKLKKKMFSYVKL